VRRLAPLALALASGCATFAPGMHVSDSQVAERGTPEAPVEILDITPKLLV